MIKRTLSQRQSFTLGADPEIFVYAGNKLLPAFEFLPRKNSKRNLYWDGFQAEWKYDHDSNYCLNNLVYFTRENLIKLTYQAETHNSKARLSLNNTVRIPATVLKTAHSEHVELGCMPSYNVYGLKGKPVFDPRTLPFRFAGGHMHFGSWYGTTPKYESIVKTLDAVLGVWSVGAARHIDNPIRREYYGLPGEYRKPQYDINTKGVEYRVLSNYWLASPEIMQLTWDLARICVRLSLSKYKALWAGNEQETIEVIQNCDIKGAELIINRNKMMVEWLLGQLYQEEVYVNKAMQVFYGGIETLAKDVNDFSENWHFDEHWEGDAHAEWARFRPFVEEGD